MFMHLLLIGGFIGSEVVDNGGWHECVKNATQLEVIQSYPESDAS